MSLSGRRPVEPRPVGDLFSPFFRVAFRSVTKETGVIQEFQDSEVFETTNLGGTASTDTSDDLERLTLDSQLLAKCAASLTIESKASAPFKFTLEMTPPHEEGIRILEHQLVTFGTLVKVQWGYTSAGGANNILSDVHVFRNQFPKAEFGENIAITLSGYDIVADVAMRNSSKRPWDRTTYPSDSDIVEALVKSVGYTMDTEDVPVTSKFLLGDPESPDVIEQITTDWTFIKKLCRDHALSFRTHGTVFKVFSMFDFKGKKIAYNLLWRAKPVTDIDIPVYTVSGNLTPYLFLPPAGRGFLSLKFNSDTGESEATKIDPAAASQTNLGDTQATTDGDQAAIDRALSMDDGDADGEVILDEETGASLIPRPRPDVVDIGDMGSQPKDAPNSDAKFEAVVKEAKALANPKIGVTCPGIPDLFPGVLTQVIGASRLFDGPYMVLGVKHSITTGGYDMDLELFRHTVVTAVGTVPESGVTDPEEGTPDAETEGPDASEGPG